MKQNRMEWIGVLVTVVGMAAVTILPFAYEGFQNSSPDPNVSVITLTGVAASGTWTDREVTGGDYWYGRFPAARPRLRLNRPVRLRLKSADVVHTFYSPQLGIGPVEVYPGHVVEIEVTPKHGGTFGYYCTTVCGMPHFGMRGEFIVGDDTHFNADSQPPAAAEYWLTLPPPATATLVERGKWVFQHNGCFTCHGAGGKGGVPDWNYIKDTVPPLNTLAERLMLFEPEDAQAIVEALESGVPLQSLAKDPPLPRFNVFLAQYQSVRNVILNGNPPGKKNPDGPAPPLEMLSWGERIPERDIDAVIAYLLTLEPWEELED
ncbi:MAG: c-type cytochrome [Acidobacteriota bacterium]